MEEFENYHPPYQFTLRPDLGGTRYDFVKELLPESVSFLVRSGDWLTKISVPGKESFICVSVEQGGNGDFLDLFYDFDGELSDARLWMKSYCKQPGFEKRARPNQKFKSALEKLEDSSTELVLEASIPDKRVYVSHYKELPQPDEYEIISSHEYELPINGRGFLEFNRYGRGKKVPSVKFAVGIEDNILSLGLCPNNKYVAHELISTNADPTRLYRQTPQAIREFLDEVFLRKD